MKTILLSFAVLLSAPACSKKDGDGGSSGAATATKLPKLGLQIDVPDEAIVGDAMMAEGNSINSAALGAMQVEIYKTPQTLDEAKADAKDFNPKNLKGDALPDGWTLTYDNTGSMGANYFTTVRRDIGGKTYKCWTTSDKKERADAVLAACKSLRK